MHTDEKLLLRTLRGEIPNRPPVWFMRQAGRYLPEYRQTRKKTKTFLDLCYSPDLAVEVTLQPLRRYDFDAAILFSDILVVPDALGQRVEFLEGEGPVLNAIRSKHDMSVLRPDGVLDHLAPVFETVAKLRSALSADKTLIGFAGSPWTVAVYMVEGRGGTDATQARRWAYGSPETFSVLMDTLVEATTRYLLKQIESGAEVIQLFDSWSGVLSERLFERLVIDPTRRIVAAIHAEFPHIPVIGFPRGSALMTERYVRETGVHGISLDSNAPLHWIRDCLQPVATVQGNLDNQLLVTGGAEMESEILRILDILGSGPFIFNLGHGILPDTPPEHVARVLELVHAK